MLKIRWYCDRLIFNVAIPIPGEDGLYIETRPILIILLIYEFSLFMPKFCSQYNSPYTQLWLWEIYIAEEIEIVFWSHLICWTRFQWKYLSWISPRSVTNWDPWRIVLLWSISGSMVLTFQWWHSVDDAVTLMPFPALSPSSLLLLHSIVAISELLAMGTHQQQIEGVGFSKFQQSQTMEYWLVMQKDHCSKVIKCWPYPPIV